MFRYHYFCFKSDHFLEGGRKILSEGSCPPHFTLEGGGGGGRLHIENMCIHLRLQI